MYQPGGGLQGIAGDLLSRAMMESFLDRIYVRNSVFTWGIGLGTIIFVTLLVAIVARILRYRFRDAPKTPGLLDDVILDLAKRTSWLFGLAVGIAIATYIVELPDHWAGHLRTATVLVSIAQGGFWATGCVHFFITAVVDRRRAPDDMVSQTGKSVARSLGMAAVWVVVLLLALENLGINISTIIAGLGVTGVAVALATQSILGDLFASFSLLLDKPFLVGDYILVDTFQGTVERIGVRSTRIRSLTGELLILPNSDLAKSRIRNYKVMNERRVLFTVAVPYDTPADKLRLGDTLIRQAIEAAHPVRFDRVQLLYLQDSFLQYEVVYYVLDRDFNLYTAIQEEINLGILQRFGQAGIRFASRCQVVYNAPWEASPFNTSRNKHVA